MGLLVLSQLKLHNGSLMAVDDVFNHIGHFLRNNDQVVILIMSSNIVNLVIGSAYHL